jgi:tRNA A58 N-methylase Trm61
MQEEERGKVKKFELRMKNVEKARKNIKQEKKMGQKKEDKKNRRQG